MNTYNNSDFLNKLGLASFDLGYLLAATAVLTFLVLVLLILLIIQIRKTGNLSGRRNSRSL